MATPASPTGASPSLEEVSKTLSINAKKKPAGLSGTESDSDSMLSPDISGPTPATFGLAPLTSIAERRAGSGEESEEDDDDDDGGRGGWRVADIKGTEAGINAGDTVIKTGYLSKKGARRKTWKKRWFVLRPAHLAYYKSSAEYQLLRLLDVSEIHAVTPIALKRHAHTFGIVTHSRTFYLQAPNQQELDSWVEQLNQARERLLATTSAASLPTPVQTPATHSASLVNDPPPSSPRTPPPPMHTQHTGSSSESDDPGPATSPNASSKEPVRDPAKTVLAGYLMKCGSKRRNWRKRWFVLTAEKLIYTGSHMDTKPHRQIPLSTVLDAIEHTSSSHHRIHHHSITQPPSSPLTPSVSAAPDEETGIPGKSFTFKIITPKRSLLLCAPSEEDEIKWLSAVRALIARRASTTKDPSSIQPTTGILASTSGGKNPTGHGTDALPLPGGSNDRRRVASAAEGKRTASNPRPADTIYSDKDDK